MGVAFSKFKKKKLYQYSASLIFTIQQFELLLFFCLEFQLPWVLRCFLDQQIKQSFTSTILAGGLVFVLFLHLWVLYFFYLALLQIHVLAQANLKKIVCIGVAFSMNFKLDKDCIVFSTSIIFLHSNDFNCCSTFISNFSCFGCCVVFLTTK